MDPTYDLIVVGAGVAGASSAIALAPDYRILLLDQAVFPRDKPCGEGIMPQGVRALAELGLLSEILASGGTTIRGMRYRNRRGIVVEADFPTGSPGAVAFGVVMRRYHLDHLLVRRAKCLPNVTVREGFKVTDVVREGDVVTGVAGYPVERPSERLVFRAPLTIGADGRHSVFHGSCRLTKTFLRRRRYGVVGHLRGVTGIDSYVEVILHRDGEIYVAPCGDGLSLVALLLEARAMKYFKGDLAGRYLEFLKSTAGFRERIAESELVPPVFAVGPLGFTVDPCYRPGLLLVGDSAGFLDPITGEGMTLALKSVKAAIPLIREAFAAGDFGAELGRRYAKRRLALMEDLFRFTRLLLALSQHKCIADRAVDRMSHEKQLFQKVLGIATGTQRYHDLSFSEKVSLLVG